MGEPQKKNATIEAMTKRWAAEAKARAAEEVTAPARNCKTCYGRGAVWFACKFERTEKGKIVNRPGVYPCECLRRRSPGTATQRWDAGKAHTALIKAHQVQEVCA